MKKNINQVNPEGIAHSKVCPGYIWKDRHGDRIIILAVSPLAVEYRRVGYDRTCTSSPGRFMRDFEYVKGSTNENDVARFIAAADGAEKIRVLREIIQERIKK
ncbi:DUF4222 domain-containing protein [Salmonella enterica]|nr:DUF4222 domain-containing protein [Salmonella enterica]